MCTRVKFGQIIISWLLDTAEQIWETSRHQKGVVDDSSYTILHHVERYIPTFRTNLVSLWSGSSIVRRGNLAFLLLESLKYRKVFIIESSRRVCAKIFNVTSWFLQCVICMLVFGIRVLVRACETAMREERRGRNNPCHYYYHREHWILNEKIFLSLSI